MKFMKQLSKIKKLLWKHKVYVVLSVLAIVLTTRALVFTNNKTEGNSVEVPKQEDYVLNGVPREEIYQSIDESGYFAKQEFYNAYIASFQKLNNIPNSTKAYRFDFFGISPCFDAVKVKVVVSYILNDKNTSQEMVENFSIIKSN